MPPATPENLHVEKADSGSVSIAWTPAKETATAPVEGYIIEIAAGDGDNFVEVAKVDGNTSQFSATGLKEGEKYNFRVRAQNAAGTSTGSTQLETPVVMSAAKPPGERECGSIVSRTRTLFRGSSTARSDIFFSLQLLILFSFLCSCCLFLSGVYF